MRTIHYLLCLWCAAAAGAAPQKHVQFAARVEPAAARAGETVKIIVTAKLDEGWHIYSLTQPPGGPQKTTIT
ncbi:MAG: hypothetical protein N2689_18355, partial [Verrucomicrobiae bacterium]|nr:hypothetical protein [Verrucomicrobiae bacterium]